jgi:DNA-binding LytR/AlgR family response regulator
VLKRADAENGWVSARKPAKEFAKANSRTYWDNLSPEQRSAEMRFEHRQRPAPFLLRLRIDGVRRAAANRLPGMDGFELARKLRKIPESRRSRLIAVTGYGTRADKAIFEEAGFDHYLPKPTNIEELDRVLEQN